MYYLLDMTLQLSLSSEKFADNVIRVVVTISLTGSTIIIMSNVLPDDNF